MKRYRVNIKHYNTIIIRFEIEAIDDFKAKIFGEAIVDNMPFQKSKYSVIIEQHEHTRKI